MKHPSETTLALYAGADLGWLARWTTARHLAACADCRREVEAYSSVLADVRALDQLPGIAWNRLAGEMRANIRLGLEAGACVSTVQDSKGAAGWVAGPRPLLAYASVLALVVASLMLERPAPRAAIPPEGVVLQVNGNGIELKDGDQALSLMHSGARGVTYSVSAQGSMRARYLDSDTGSVTINNVYAQ